jgi:hypothetical protein
VPNNSKASLSKVSVHTQIKKMYQQTNRPINILGHSVGGLLAAQYISSGYIGNIITVSSPFRGTPLSKYISYSNTRSIEVAPNSQYLVGLHLKLTNTDKIIYCIGSRCDPNVPFPWCTTYTSKHWYQIDRVGHVSILFSTKLWRVVNLVLNR